MIVISLIYLITLFSAMILAALAVAARESSRMSDLQGPLDLFALHAASGMSPARAR